MHKNRKALRVGMIGSGFMGKCHANAFRSYAGLFNSQASIELYKIADISDSMARESAASLGFVSSTGDWRDLVDDPLVDIVSITAPNALHETIALRAIENNKVVYCEKPLSTTSSSARLMTLAAEDKSIVTMVGFNFLRNPLVKMCREIINSGELGEVISFKGRHAENYMVSQNVPHSFRTEVVGGGALADIGSHIISMSRYLLGDISEVIGRCRTVIKSRPIKKGSNEMAPVSVDDLGHALLQFSNGAIGNIEANWMANGRTMDLSFEVSGTKGAIAFSQERMNELLIWEAGKSIGCSGFKKIEAGPDHPPYGNFCPAPGHHLGFNDLKIIEVSELIDSILTGKEIFTNFREGYIVQSTIDAIFQSSKTHQWTPVLID